MSVPVAERLNLRRHTNNRQAKRARELRIDVGRSIVEPVHPNAYLTDAITNVPNAITLVRTVAAVVVAAIAISEGRPVLIGASYAIYWLGDVLDGWTARRLGQETRLGAVFDIISDRACTSILCVGLIVYVPDLSFVAIPFFCSFMVLDTMLSLAFLFWPIVSPNYFYRVDPTIYRLNWSPLAKAANTAGVVLLALVGATWAALSLTVALLGVKVWSANRVIGLLKPVTTEGAK